MTSVASAFVDSDTSFIESFAGGFFCGYGTPSGLASYANAPGYLLTATVTGAAGAYILTINTGTVADMGGVWIAVITHDDGTMGTYTVSGASGASCNIAPALRATCTAALMSNLHDASNGQHLTAHGYQAYAKYLFGYSPRLAYRGGYHAQASASDATGYRSWRRYGGLTTGRWSYGIYANTFEATPTNPYGTQNKTKDTLSYVASPAASGQGVHVVWDMGSARSGLVDFSISSNGTRFGGGATLPVDVVILADDVAVLTQSYHALSRVTYYAQNVSKIEIRCTMAARSDDGFQVGTATWWYDGSTPDAMIPSGSTVVVMGDSWPTRYSSAFVDQLQSELTAAGGGTVAAVSSDGQTTEWGIANFDSSVIPLAPSHVVISFGINDLNGGMLLSRYCDNLKTLIRKTQEIGARAIVLMPPGTASSGQMLALSEWQAQMNEGALFKSAALVLRSQKGSELTWNEVDANFTAIKNNADIVVPTIGQQANTFYQTQTYDFGSLRVNSPFINATQTWAASWETFTAIKFNITDTSSAVGSKLCDLQIGSASVFSVTKNGDIAASNATNGQSIGIKSLTELLTIAAAATSTTTIQKPANSIVLAVSVRVTTAVTCTSTFTVGDSTSAARFSTAAVSKAINSTDKGTKAGAYYNATAEGIVITPDTTPSDATGRVRVTIHYIEVTPPTS